MTPYDSADIRRRIWSTLDLFHRGHVSAVTQEALAAYLGINGRILRKHIKHLREHEGKPIGSTCCDRNPGYFVMVDVDDLRIGFMSRWRAATSHIAGLRKQAAMIPGFVTMDLELTREAGSCTDSASRYIVGAQDRLVERT